MIKRELPKRTKHKRPTGVSRFILKEDETPTSIGDELRQFRLGGSPISFQDKASGGSQRRADESSFGARASRQERRWRS